MQFHHRQTDMVGVARAESRLSLPSKAHHTWMTGCSIFPEQIMAFEYSIFD
jgi:hypothetical protein